MRDKQQLEEDYSAGGVGMSVQDKYKWNSVKLQGQLWARGLTQKAMDLHNDSIEALAIEMGQQGRDDDETWTLVIELEDKFRELRKDLNEIKKEVSQLV